MASASRYNAAVDLIDRNVEGGRAGRVAFIDPDRQLTYGELLTEAGRCQRLLAALDVRREERVAMLMLDTVEFPIVFLGAIRSGIVPVPINTLLAADLYATILADCRAGVLFVSSALLPAVEPVLARLPHLRHVVVVGGPAEKPRIAFAEALAAQASGAPPADTHEDEPCFWLYSSGSTGAPKGVRHVHSSPMATARLYAQPLLGIGPDDVCLSAAKLFFAYGLGNALTFPMSVGGTAILNPVRPTPVVMFELMAKHSPTLFFGVPTLYAAMLADPALKGERGSSRLRLCVSAGEALPEHIGRNWKARFGVDILDGVGSTEMLHIFLSNHPGDVVYGTSGRPVAGYDVRLVDEKGAEVAPGEVGELLVQGETSADGYWNQRGKSRATFEGRWTRTGDKYTRDASGRFTYCGRTDDMFKVSGIWVSPFEVEAALASYDAVLEAAVVPAEDEDGLLKPKAFVVLKPGNNAAGLEDRLREHVKNAVGLWKYPRWIEVVESLPKTATGKIQRFKLRDQVRHAH
jgi:4-hydroxybenzoate-CoA ligase